MMFLVFVPSYVVLIISTVVFSTSESQFLPGFDNQGWYANGLEGAATEENDNYMVGVSNRNNLLRNFFTFDLASLIQNDRITTATLRLRRARSFSFEAFETLEFYDVSTNPAELNRTDG